MIHISTMITEEKIATLKEKYPGIKFVDSHEEIVRTERPKCSGAFSNARGECREFENIEEFKEAAKWRLGHFLKRFGKAAECAS